MMNLELVECNVCHGVGKLFRDNEHWKYCPRCLGAGKLDWVEIIVGKRPPSLKDGWTINWGPNYQLSKNKFSSKQGQEIINKLATQISKDIDEDIIKELSGK